MLESGNSNLNYISHDIENLLTGTFGPIDYDFMQACRGMNSYAVDVVMPHFVVRDIQPFQYDYNKDDVVLLFSGGKVSTATALKLRSLHKNVTLYYLERSPRLTSRINEMAEALKLPLVICTDKAPGNNCYIGMWLAHEAEKYAVEKRLSPKVYMGYFPMASILNNEYENWKYCLEFINTYSRVIKKYIYGGEVVSIIPSYSVADDEFIRNKDLLRFFEP